MQKQGAFNHATLIKLQQSAAQGVTAITQDTFLDPDVAQVQQSESVVLIYVSYRC